MLNSLFGNEDYQVLLGSEHLSGNIIGSIGIIGFIFFTTLNIHRIYFFFYTVVGNEYPIFKVDWLWLLDDGWRDFAFCPAGW